MANAGMDRTALAGATITLDGSGSSDREDDATALTYIWSQLSGPDALADRRFRSNEMSPTITLRPDLPVGAVLVFRLSLSDTGEVLRPRFAHLNDVDTVTITVVSAGVTVSETALTINGGAAASYTVVLDSQPSADVIITPASSDVDVATFEPTSLSFNATNWATAQTVSCSITRCL